MGILILFIIVAVTAKECCRWGMWKIWSMKKLDRRPIDYIAFAAMMVVFMSSTAVIIASVTMLINTLMN